ncbi:MAG: SurA N-terminal domain-containing protein [Candidatus Daviesbacteria bacterium]|nr:SurA N-terminal domain-containing protein [Candidatus Daviesbacteria bacterium]
MPAAKVSKKKVVKKTPVKSEINDSEIYASSAKGFSLNSLLKPEQLRKNKLIYLAIVIIIIALIASYKKGLFIAATVNGAPITNLEVLKREDEQFHQTTVEKLIEEKLILGEAQKKGVKVTEAEIDAKIADIEKQVGGAAALDSLLTQQGQTRTGIRTQIKISLSLEKMYQNEASVSAEEITKFIEENKEQLQSSTPAEMTKEATDYLRSQKLNQVFSQKFQEIKKAANIQIF